MTDQPELHIDEDWKSKVKAEDAALDQKLGSKKEASPTPSPSEPQFPPADFQGLLLMLSTQVMMGLGMLPPSENAKPSINLPMAKYFIDLIAVLSDSTKNNLSADDRQILDQTLSQLRIGYVEVSKNKS